MTHTEKSISQMEITILYEYVARVLLIFFKEIMFMLKKYTKLSHHNCFDLKWFGVMTELQLSKRI